MSDAEQIRSLGLRAERLRAALAEQTPPVAAEGDVWAEIIARTEHPDLRALYAERRRQGVERYGTPLQRGNGRNFLADALQEALDLLVYLEGANARESLRLRAEDLIVAIMADLQD